MNLVTEKIIDFDIVFLSYDEPNADENYDDLLKKIPWAKRIHGVKGSDSAHKACADIAETERVVIIDGDNIVSPDFIKQEVEFEQDSDMTQTVYSWVARNNINGLVYGNGGIKCWPTTLIKSIRTHENALSDAQGSQIDFCWDINYYAQEKVMSNIHNNASPYQAWRAGFREGVKMALNSGSKQTKLELLNSHWKNLHRLYIWSTVGADVKNGIWAIYGARQGLHKTMCTDWDYIQVRDFEHLNNLWKEVQEDVNGVTGVRENVLTYGKLIEQELGLPIPIEPMSPEHCVFFKHVYLNPKRNSDGIIL